MRTKLALALALSALPFAGAAAQSRFTQLQPFPQQQTSQQTRYSEMDYNGDGVITRGEWRSSAQAFTNADWNGDGILSGDEVRANTATPRRRSQTDQQLRTQRTSRFRSMDRNRDGYVVRGEWTGSEEEFQALDQDYDYVLSRVEIVNPERAARLTASKDSFIPYANNGVSPAYPVATSGQIVTIDPKARWTDTGLDVVAGERIVFQSEGSMQLSLSPAGVDVATPAGAPRKAKEAPLRQEAAGAVIAKIGDSSPMLVGAQRTISRAPASGRLYLGVNDDYLDDNSGEFRVSITIDRR
jgi:hypothetical protein